MITSWFFLFQVELSSLGNFRIAGCVIFDVAPKKTKWWKNFTPKLRLSSRDTTRDKGYLAIRRLSICYATFLVWVVYLVCTALLQRASVVFPYLLTWLDMRIASWMSVTIDAIKTIQCMFEYNTYKVVWLAACLLTSYNVFLIIIMHILGRRLSTRGTATQSCRYVSSLKWPYEPRSLRFINPPRWSP